MWSSKRDKNNERFLPHHAWNQISLYDVDHSKIIGKNVSQKLRSFLFVFKSCSTTYSVFIRHYSNSILKSVWVGRWRRIFKIWKGWNWSFRGVDMEKFYVLIRVKNVWDDDRKEVVRVYILDWFGMGKRWCDRWKNVE